MTTTHPEDISPQLATLMELIRSVLNLSRLVDPNRTRDDHRRAVVAAVPSITGNVDVLLHGDLIDAVFAQEGIN